MVTGPNSTLDARRALSLRGTLDTGLAGLGTRVIKCERLPGTAAPLVQHAAKSSRVTSDLHLDLLVDSKLE